MDAKWTEILSAWGTESADIRLRKPGVWEIDQRFMLKAYEDEKSLERNVQFLTVLAECGAPSARIIKTRDGEAYGKAGGKCWLMTAKLPGNSLADIRDPGAAEKMGETIARLHAILRKCEKKLTLWDNSLLDEMEGWVRQTLQQNGWKTGSGSPCPDQPPDFPPCPSCQKATALAAATFRESTPWDMGMRTV